MYVCMHVTYVCVCMNVVCVCIYLSFNDVNNSQYTGSEDIGSMNNEFRTMCKNHHSVLPQPVVLTCHRSHSTAHQAPTASLLLPHHPAVFGRCYNAISVGLTAVVWVLTAISNVTAVSWQRATSMFMVGPIFRGSLDS